jgi:hypothetical protein
MNNETKQITGYVNITKQDQFAVYLMAIDPVLSHAMVALLAPCYDVQANAFVGLRVYGNLDDVSCAPDSGLHKVTITIEPMHAPVGGVETFPGTT